MLIRVRRNPTDFIDQKPHPTLSRREFIRRGLLTGTMSIAVPHALTMAIARQAYGGTITCPPPSVAPGALAGLMRVGGPTMGSMFLGADMLAAIQTTGSSAATGYGINPANIVQPGSNWWVPAASAFATGLGLNGNQPPGYTAAQWAAVLQKTAMTSQIGSFPFDDGVGQNMGFNAAASPFKGSKAGSDLQINTTAAKAAWAMGLPASAVGTDPAKLTATTLAGAFSLTPKGNAVNAFTNASAAASSLVQSFTGILFNKSTSPAFSKAVCGFQSAKTVADPTFATSLFSASAIPTASLIQPASLTAAEQSWLLAFYQSAIGGVGGVFLGQNGQDYHGQSVQNTIAPGDYEAGRMVAMFLAACDAAGKPGAMIIVSNGQAIANGFQAATIANSQKVTLNVEGPVAKGDSGGTFNAGFLLVYNPSSAPVLKASGTKLNTSTGHFLTPVVNRVDVGVASLYLTALTYLSGSQTGYNLQGLQNAIQTAIPGQTIPVLI